MSIFKDKRVKLGLIITSLVLSVVSIFGVCKGLSKMQTTKDVNFANYSIASVDESGKVIESKLSFITKDMLKTEDMKIEVDKDANITYNVVFYDADKQYVSTTTVQSESFNTSNVPETAKYFRVIITPNQIDGEDVKINAINLIKYAKQIEITYGK